MKDIKSNYKPVYTNSFGKVKVDPLRRDFFKSGKNLEINTTSH